MARYERSYAGERRTEHVGFQSPRASGPSWKPPPRGRAPAISVYARELLFRRSAAVVAGTRRNPEAAGARCAS